MIAVDLLIVNRAHERDFGSTSIHHGLQDCPAFHLATKEPEIYSSPVLVRRNELHDYAFNLALAEMLRARVKTRGKLKVAKKRKVR